MKNHLDSLSLGSSTSRIQVSQLREAAILFPWQPHYLSRDIWILSPWQGAAQATRCLCFAVEALHSDNFLSGDRVVARQVAGREQAHLGMAGAFAVTTELRPMVCR